MAILHLLLKALEITFYFAWTFVRVPAHIALVISYEILEQEEMILLMARTLGEAIMQIFLAFVSPLFAVMACIPSTKKRTMRMDNPAFGGRGQGIHVREKNRFARPIHSLTMMSWQLPNYGGNRTNIRQKTVDVFRFGRGKGMLGEAGRSHL